VPLLSGIGFTGDSPATPEAHAIDSSLLCPWSDLRHRISTSVGQSGRPHVSHRSAIPNRAPPCSAAQLTLIQLRWPGSLSNRY